MRSKSGASKSCFEGILAAEVPQAMETWPAHNADVHVGQQAPCQAEHLRPEMVLLAPACLDHITLFAKIRQEPVSRAGRKMGLFRPLWIPHGDQEPCTSRLHGGKSARHPRWISAWPMPHSRWVFPLPGLPNASTFSARSGKEPSSSTLWGSPTLCGWRSSFRHGCARRSDAFRSWGFRPGVQHRVIGRLIHFRDVGIQRLFKPLARGHDGLRHLRRDGFLPLDQQAQGVVDGSFALACRPVQDGQILFAGPSWCVPPPQVVVGNAEAAAGKHIARWLQFSKVPGVRTSQSMMCRYLAWCSPSSSSTTGASRAVWNMV